MKIIKTLRTRDAPCIALLVFILVGTLNSNIQRAYEPFKAYGQTTESELVYAIGGDAGEVLVLNATSNTVLTIHPLSAGSVVFAKIGLNNIYWVIKGAGTTFDVIRIKGDTILSSSSYVNVCNSFNNAYEITGVNSLDVVCKQFGNNTNVQFLTVSNGAVSSNTTQVNWNLENSGATYSPYLINNLYHASSGGNDVFFRVGTNQSISQNSIQGTVSGFEFNDVGYAVTANNNTALWRVSSGGGVTQLSVAPRNIAGSSNGIAPYAVRDTNIVILPIQALNQFIRMSLPTGNIIQNITLSAGHNGYGTANKLSDGSFDRLYKGNNGDDNLGVYFSNGTLITNIDPTGAIGFLTFMEYAGQHTLTSGTVTGEPVCIDTNLDGTEDLCFQDTNGDGVPDNGIAGSLGAFNSNANVTQMGTQWFCAFNIGDACNDSNPQTNGVGTFFTIIIIVFSYALLVGIHIMAIKQIRRENVQVMDAVKINPVLLLVVLFLDIGFAWYLGFVENIIFYTAVVFMVGLAGFGVYRELRGGGNG